MLYRKLLASFQSSYFSEPEAATEEVLYKESFLKILQTSQQRTCVGVSFLLKLQASGL